MIGVGGYKGFQGLDGGILLPLRPLASGKQNLSTFCGSGSPVLFDHTLQAGNIVGFVEFGSGAVFLATDDASVNHEGGGGYSDDNGQNNEVPLIAIQKLLEGAGTLDDFTDRAWAIWAVCGHGELACVKAAEKRQSGTSHKINA